MPVWGQGREFDLSNSRGRMGAGGPRVCCEHGRGHCCPLTLCLPSAPQTNEWNKNDDRLLQAVENGDAEKVASLLGKKGASATKQDSEGKTA